MELLLGNLLDNAIRYSGETHAIVITARTTDTGVALDVEDKGVGIDEAQVTHVMEKFFRGRGARSGSGRAMRAPSCGRCTRR